MSKTVAFGNNEYTEILSTILPLDAIVDEYTQQNAVHGIPVVDLSCVSQSDKLINCVYNSRAAFAQKKLISLNFNPTFIGDFVDQYPDKFKSTMLAQAQVGINQDLLDLEDYKELFVDQQSKQEFSSILQFRKTLNIKHLLSFDVKIDEQYFEDFVLDKKFNCLLDGGSYDGHDAIRFIQLSEPVEQVVLFEPNVKNICLIESNISKRNMSSFLSSGKITIRNACFSDKLGYAFLEGEGTETKITAIVNEQLASHNNNGGDISSCIETTTIDREVTECVSKKTDARILVKLDIEGAEMSALNGAVFARENKNVGFAISAYHLPHDLLDIFRWLQASSITRQYYFRHYSNGICESVLFAI